MYSVIGTDGQVYGPVDIPTLQRWCQEGRIVPDSNLIDPRDGRVLSAVHVTQLSGFFQKTQTYAPPPGNSPYGSPPYGSPTGSPYAQGPFPQQSYHRFPGMAPMVSTKNKIVAILLAFFLGVFGAHRFYLGHTGTGVLMLLLSVCTCAIGGTAITGIWALVDLILIATGSLKDASGAELS